MEDIRKLREEFDESCKGISSLKELDDLRIRYLGRNGIITKSLKQISSLPKKDRPRIGKNINELKRYIEDLLSRTEKDLATEEAQRKILSEKIDITLPGKFIPPGHSHPINIVLGEITDIFVSMGFSVEEGPEAEVDYYNFEALNIPKDHPARDMQDTFYLNLEDIRQKAAVDRPEQSIRHPSSDLRLPLESDVVLRTHTSPVQIRVMERVTPPFRFIAPGKVYRCDADLSHTPMFHQVEGLMVGEDITFSHLKGILELFIHSFFSPETPVRFRPSYFPFTEPSAEIDIGCIFCEGKGCRVCKGTGWIEVLGAGMVHPRVFEAVGYDAERFTGFAFGMGVERLTMLKYGIDDIRLFFENDLRFLKQF
jgi:phenylalanyl-tRNA synthetase alpha chain